MKKTGEIYQTKNYGLFSFHKDNREFDYNHVNRLYKSMLIHGWIRGSYVVVNRLYQIIDGQHRFLAAQKAGVSMYFIMDDKITSDEISLINTNKKNWNIITHLQKFVKLGNPHYVVLDKFMKNYPSLRPTECTMLVRNSLGSADREIFESGNFKVKDMKLAYEWAYNIMRLKPYFEKGYNKSIFVRALIKILTSKPEFKFDEFIHKVELRPKSLVMCGTVDQYVGLIEEIYNYRRPDKLNFRF